MQEEEETLGIAGYGNSSVATPEITLHTDTQRDTPDERVEAEEFALPSKKQRKANAKKQINLVEEAPLEGKTKRRRNVPDIGGEGVSTSGTGESQLP